MLVFEGFFAILIKRRLKRGVFRSVVDLQDAINRFLEHQNARSNPFQWTADPDKIIARRGQEKTILPVRIGLGARLRIFWKSFDLLEILGKSLELLGKGLDFPLN